MKKENEKKRKWKKENEKRKIKNVKNNNNFFKIFHFPFFSFYFFYIFHFHFFIFPFFILLFFIFIFFTFSSFPSFVFWIRFKNHTENNICSNLEFPNHTFLVWIKKSEKCPSGEYFFFFEHSLRIQLFTFLDTIWSLYQKVYYFYYNCFLATAVFVSALLISGISWLRHIAAQYCSGSKMEDNQIRWKKSFSKKNE